MTQRTSEMHPFNDCPYKPKVTGVSFVEDGQRMLFFDISIIDTRTGEQVEGQVASTKRGLRSILRERMAFWRERYATLAAKEPDTPYSLLEML